MHTPRSLRHKLRRALALPLYTVGAILVVVGAFVAGEL